MNISIGTRRLAAVLTIVVAATMTTACQTMSKRDAGTGIGAALGAAIGYAVDDGGIGGVLVGAAVGGIAGRMIGGHMEDSDRQKMAQALDETQAGETTRWKNEETGNEFAVTPTSAAYDQQEDRCRDFEQEVFIDGKREVIQASACRKTEDDPWVVEA
jgi:surface antigen